jgi:hypothetical protein
MNIQIEILSSKTAAGCFAKGQMIPAGGAKTRIGLPCLNGDRLRLVAAQSKLLVELPKRSFGRNLLDWLGFRKWVVLSVEAGGVKGIIQVNMGSLHKRYGISLFKLFFKTLFTKKADVTGLVRHRLPDLVQESTKAHLLWRKNLANLEKIDKIAADSFMDALNAIIQRFKNKKLSEVRDLSSKGDGSASLYLADRMEQGEKKGVEFLIQAAKQRCALAEYVLGFNYFYGSEVKQDIDLARYNFKRAHTDLDKPLRQLVEAYLKLGDRFLPKHTPK